MTAVAFVTHRIVTTDNIKYEYIAPIYTVDMLHRHRPARALRSANNNDLQVPSTSRGLIIFYFSIIYVLFFRSV